MKFALHAWCDKETLAQADEIIVDYKEKERILDYPEDFPQTAVTIHVRQGQDIDWEWLKGMRHSFPFGFTIGTSDIQTFHKAHEYELKSYLLSYISTFAELNRFYKENAAYVYLNQPLFSMHEKIKRFNIPVRWTPNIIDASGQNCLIDFTHGTWIRPEDIELYDIIPKCIVEFPGMSSSKAEQALFQVYKKGIWEQDLGLLLPQLKDMGIANYLIHDDFGKMRCNCGQICETFPNATGCHACNNAILLANKEILNDYFNNTPIK